VLYYYTQFSEKCKPKRKKTFRLPKKLALPSFLFNSFCERNPLYWMGQAHPGQGFWRILDKFAEEGHIKNISEIREGAENSGD